MTRNRLFKRADVFLGALLSPLYFYFALFPRRAKPPPSLHKMLVSKLCCFGDGLLSLYALRSLKEKYPGLALTVLAGARTREIFERSGVADRVLVLPLSGTGGLREFGKFFRVAAVFFHLWREKFDAFVDFNLYYRFTALLGLLCGRKFSAGFALNGRGSLFYHHKADRPRDEAEWRSFYRLLAPLGVAVRDTPAPLNFRIDPGERAAADQWLSLAPADKRKVAVVPGASPNWPENRWPVAHFAQAMREINGRCPSAFFIVGEAGETPLARALAEARSECTVVDVTGKTPFPVLVGLALKMDLWLSNDTGPMHLAAALGRPALGLFGPTNDKKWSPPGRFKALFSPHCRCRPCNYLSHMPDCGYQACLEKVTPAGVAQAAVALLEEARL